ncbi:MAG: A/G-specific adenine glycosylase [Saprospiraceae bacterium]
MSNQDPIRPRQFAQRLERWSRDIDRPLPWRGERDPYRIWLSEILLQQTRAASGIPYYLRFLEAFPTVHHLSHAPLDQVLKLWEGLGYYNRAQNLHKTATIVSQQLEGRFPDTYEGLLQLPGIGPYTAAAIASFAFGKRHAVLDGNVIRVLSRLTGMTEPVDLPESRHRLQSMADRLLGKHDPATFNQAIMDFGALQCIPRNPDCGECPFAGDCQAYLSGTVDQLPLKKKKAPVRHRYFTFFVVVHRGSTFLIQRDQDDIWRQLFTFPSAESSSREEMNDPERWARTIHAWNPQESRVDMRPLSVHTQLLSHQRIHAQFVLVLPEQELEIPDHWVPVHGANFTTFALPKIIREFLSSDSSYLPVERTSS